MKIYRIGELVDLQSFLCAIANRFQNSSAELRFRPDQHALIRQKIERFSELLAEACLSVSSGWATKISEGWNIESSANGEFVYSGQNKDNLTAGLGQIANTVGNELMTKMFLAIPYINVPLYEPTEPLFGTEVARQFPSLSYDVSEAAKCIALERSTAAAFHSVRCLEGGLRAISRCLAIPDPTKGSERSWTKSLSAIKTEMDKRWPASGRLSGDGRLFEEIYAVLSAMQNPWRNATMHLDQKYTEEEARNIFNSVGVLMKRLASRCDENGEPKA
jgi:hypothetical protein